MLQQIAIIIQVNIVIGTLRKSLSCHLQDGGKLGVDIIHMRLELEYSNTGSFLELLECIIISISIYVPSPVCSGTVVCATSTKLYSTGALSTAVS